MNLFKRPPPNVEKLARGENFKGLIKALKHKNSEIRAQAASHLEWVDAPNPEALEPLIQVLKGEEWEVRYGAAVALGKIKDRRAIKPLQ